MEQIWAVLVKHREELAGVEWKWQPADSALGKPHFGAGDVGPNPTDRAKNSTNKNLLVEG